MSRLKLTLAYDGTDFAGWQSQRGRPQRTVQGVLEAALSQLCGGQPVSVEGAGRTDAGVHALGQVASVSLPRPWAPAELQHALNATLPPDLRVRELISVPEGFHARRDARSKLYRYELDLGPWQLPGRRRLAAHHSGPWDDELAQRAAALYLGRHDFASLATAGGGVRTTTRHVTRSQLRLETREGGPFGTLVYETEADGYLRKMVRNMVGGILEAGTGARTLASLREALEACDRRAWPAPAPARGLTLVRVDYPPLAAANGVDRPGNPGPLG